MERIDEVSRCRRGQMAGQEQHRQVVAIWHAAQRALRAGARALALRVARSLASLSR